MLMRRIRCASEILSGEFNDAQQMHKTRCGLHSYDYARGFVTTWLEHRRLLFCRVDCNRVMHLEEGEIVKGELLNEDEHFWVIP